MPIKYGEITVIHNDDEDGFFKSIFRNLGGYEFKTNENSKIVVLFEDGDIFEINDKLTDFNYTFVTDISSPIPLHFKTNKKLYNIYFKKKPHVDEKSQLRINFHDLFKSFNKYSKKNIIASVYNFIYYRNTYSEENEVFGVVRLKSNENKPRFLFAYDCLNFSKDEILYLINTIFKNKIES